MTATMSGSSGRGRRAFAGMVVAASLTLLDIGAPFSGGDTTLVSEARPGTQLIVGHRGSLGEPVHRTRPDGAGGDASGGSDGVATSQTTDPSTPPAPQAESALSAPVTEPAPTTAPPQVTAPPPEPVPPAAPVSVAPTTVPGSDDGRAVQRLGDTRSVTTASAALGLVRVDWRALLPGWQIRFLPGRAGLRGATFPDSDLIEVYVRSSDSPGELAHVVAHELGHAIDVSRFRESDRLTWKAARGIASGAAWFPSGSAVPDFASPAGDWAESFAYAVVGSDWNSQLGAPPNAAQAALVVGLAGIG